MGETENRLQRCKDCGTWEGIATLMWPYTIVQVLDMKTGACWTESQPAYNEPKKCFSEYDCLRRQRMNMREKPVKPLRPVRYTADAVLFQQVVTKKCYCWRMLGPEGVCDHCADRMV